MGLLVVMVVCRGECIAGTGQSYAVYTVYNNLIAGFYAGENFYATAVVATEFYLNFLKVILAQTTVNKEQTLLLGK